ncbi:MAG: hypothetical protein ACRDK9_00950 [Solirubrobacterales bacterium]
MPARSHFARVAVDEERWAAFRRVALERGLSISAHLGRLVEAELKRREGLGLVSAEAAPDDEQALSALAAVRASIDELDAIAGRLARSAVAHGGSWEDVAGRLRLNRDRAEAAYGGSPAGID